MTTAFPPPREITLRFLAATTDVNFFGNIHGGAVMKWIDEAAYVCAAGWCGCNCVTVYVGGIRFYRPVHVGDLVELRAKLIYTGETSMHIAVDVLAGSPRAGERHKTTHCITVFVALDENGRPTTVPSWQPETEADKALHAYALRLMDLRKDIEAEMRPHLAE
jgi:acyl-CoA hydrolase